MRPKKGKFKNFCLTDGNVALASLDAYLQYTHTTTLSLVPGRAQDVDTQADALSAKDLVILTAMSIIFCARSLL
jgi:hypothetical protein